jgi:uncharacterized repeat protein (TIGR03803 family)
MPSKKLLAVFVAAFSLILGSLAIATPLFAASSEKVLYNFCSANNCTDGSGPLSGLIFDKDGNLYGTTYNGGAGQSCEEGCGTVFELIPINGKWTEKVLHSFYPNGGGNLPSASPILDSAGNLYGTTFLGGNSGAGVVFELIRGNGKWTEKVLDTPGDSTAPLIFDPSGNLYGTSIDDPSFAFELIHDNGKWTEKVLHYFTGQHDGYFLYAPMIFDSAGNLYGTAYYGGIYGYGTVFELIPNNGKWTEKVLHSFNYDGKDGASPYAGLILDSAGNLYGTTQEGGTGTGCYRGCGIVFELIPGKNGARTRKILHNFNLDGVDGEDPIGGLIFDKNGNLYGTTLYGGDYGVGTVYELTPGNGKWTEKVLHAFNGKDGADPSAGLVMDKAGHLYGTTAEGGTHMNGVVFEVTP